MTDGNWVLDRAEALMGEQADRERGLEVINLLRHEVYPVSETFVLGRVCPELKRLEQGLELDDAVAQTVLPYGVAAHLMLGEDDVMASFFQQRYEGLLLSMGRRKEAVWEEIVV